MVAAVALAGPTAFAEAQSEGVSLAAIADVMAAREAATVPFVVRYTLRHYRLLPTGTRIDWIACSEGSIALAHRSLVRRERFYHCRPGQDRSDRKGMERWEAVRAWDGARWLHLSRRAGQGKPWSGTISAIPGDRFLRSPEEFGLIEAGRPYSDRVRRAGAEVIGEDRFGSFSCLKVLLNAAEFDGTGSFRPYVLWLSIGQGYYPVLSLHYGSAPTEIPGSEPLQLVYRGQRYYPLVCRMAERLVRVGRGWIPARAVARFDLSGTRGYKTLEIDESSLRVGEAQTAAAFRLDEIEHARVRNEQSKTWEYRGSKPGAVAPERLRAISERAVAEGISRAARAPAGRLSRRTLAALVLLGMFGGFVLIRLRRKTQNAQ